MIAEEKTKLAAALDLIDDYLGSGYAHDRGAYVFTDDPPENTPESAAFRENSPPEEGSLRETRDTREALAEDIRSCTACPLYKIRDRAVPGDGVNNPLVLIVGDVPGKTDEESGAPFAGEAGEFLDRMLKPIALSRRTNCFLTNRVKCRPPDGRPPTHEETTACLPFLKRELALLKPLIVLGFETTAAAPGENGERYADFPETSEMPFFSTYHPAMIHSDERLKRPVWEKLKALSSALTALDRDYAEALRTGGNG
jgi:DNA polymerase